MNSETPSTTPTTPTPPSGFLTFGLSPAILKAMAEMGFTQPTPIQEKALPLLLGPAQDFIGLASTGTGKTAAFGVPLLEKIDATIKATQALVLSPTRELAMQVAEQLQKLGKHKGIRVVTIYGGSSYSTQIEGVRKGAHIVVATPGRLVDFLEQKIIKLQEVQTLVLDEADEMISMGFKDDLEFILKHTHNEGAAASGRAACKTWLFSATMSRDIRRVADTYLDKPVTIEVAKTQGMSDLVKQVYYTVKDENKNEVIGRLLQIYDNFYGIIFCQTKMEVIDLEDRLQKRGFAVASLHGDKQQKEREVTLRRFRSGECKVLVATDVAARGLDVKDLTHVVNHSLPWDVESYIHRIGRTGRAGKEGTAVSLVNPRQISSLRRLQTVTKKTLEKGQIPTASEVAAIRMKKFMAQLTAVNSEGRKYQLALELFNKLVPADETGTLSAATPELLARVITAIHPEIIAEKDYDLDFMKGPLEQSRDRRDSRGGDSRTLSGGTRHQSSRGGYTSRRDDRGPRSDDRRPSYNDRPAAAAPRSEDRRPSFNDDRGPREERAPRFAGNTGGERRVYTDSAAPRAAAPRTDDSYPRRDRGPRFDGFDFAESGPRKERSASDGDRPVRKDHPGIKRHRPGGIKKRHFAGDNA